MPASSWRDLHRVRAPDADTHLGRDFTYLAGSYRTAAIPVQAFPALHGEPVTEPANAHPEAPEDGNIECEERKWTLKEQLALDHALACWARWTVDFGRRTVKSTKCEGTMMDKSGVCDACRKLAKKDAGFKKAIARVRVCRVPCWTSVMAYMQFVEEKGVQATRRCATAQVCAEREVCTWNPPSG